MQLVFLIIIHQVVIYLVDGAIQPLNNQVLRDIEPNIYLCKLLFSITGGPWGHLVCAPRIFDETRKLDKLSVNFGLLFYSLSQPQVTWM